MKKIVVLIAVVVFSFAMTAIAFPPLPDDLNIIAPDPSSLPKELAAFSGKSGKWEGITTRNQFFLIVEKIDQEKATLRLSDGRGWERVLAAVEKKYGKYRLWFLGRYGINELSLRGEGKYLDLSTWAGSVILTRVP